MYQTLNEEAWSLVHSIATQSESQHGLGTMSPAAYDTAWVAMTEKRGEDGKLRPLFPEAYEYLKQTQSDDGSWAAETSDADGIVNTLAALLALKRQERQFEEMRADNERRCRAAEDSLRRMLGQWDLDAADRVGLEILVPNMLRLLETEGISFDFPSRKPLMALNEAKLARLGPILTSPVQTTLIHTLEAFVGTLDFDKVKHHKMPNGSMLASPSSTAAYLMNSSTWDNDAEAYLRTVFDQKAATGHKGGFPSAFPSTLFEVSWVLGLLLESGFEKEDFLLADVRKLTVLLEENLKAQKGIVGFLPASLPDADDTAKTISALALLGWNKEIEPMLKAFEAETSFITYRGERNASSSANCNILSCLLKTPEPAKYTKQIVKCAEFLSKTWMANDGPDKWHISVQYPMMLIAQAFMLFLKRWGKGELDADAIPKKLLHQDIPRTLLDILARTMRLQEADGSWESKREVTAYAVLTLTPLLSLPWVDFLRPEGIACMYRGKAYLENSRNQWRDAERLWIEKTVYSSSHLSQAYCLAASKIVVPTAVVSQRVADLFPAQVSMKIAKMSGFFSSVVPFRGEPKWKLQLSLLQSATYSAALKDWRYTIFPPIEKASDEKYQEYIPFTWIGCRDFLSTSIPAEALWGMMIVSLLGFQVDAYMETVVLEQYRDDLPALKDFIRRICTGQRSQRKRTREDDIGGVSKKSVGPNGVSNGHTNGVSKKANGVSNGDVHVNGVSENGVNGHTQNGHHTANGTCEDNAVKEPSAKVEVNGAHDGLNGSEVISNGVNGHATNGVNGVNGVNGFKKPEPPVKASVQTESSDGAAEDILTKFVKFVLEHPKVAQAPPSLRSWLAYEVQTYLLAHITHLEDCLALAESSDLSKESFTWAQPRTTFFTWVRTTSADLTSCCYAFVFFLCLISDSGRNLVGSVQQRYALEDACRHLATMCRQYNDLGSLARDHDEKNLNSVNFPEFEGDLADAETLGTKEVNDSRKRDLFGVAEYERRCLGRVLSELEESLDPSVMEKLKLFVQVTDFYGQIYIARDIGIRLDAEKKQNGVHTKAISA